MKKILLVLTLLFVLGFSKESKAQISSTGKTFYMSFMEMETRNGGYPDTLLIFVTSEIDTKVTLDNPRLSKSGFLHQTLLFCMSRIKTVLPCSHFAPLLTSTSQQGHMMRNAQMISCKGALAYRHFGNPCR